MKCPRRPVEKAMRDRKGEKTLKKGKEIKIKVKGRKRVPGKVPNSYPQFFRFLFRPSYTLYLSIYLSLIPKKNFICRLVHQSKD